MRYLVGFLCVYALGLMPLVGCSETGLCGSTVCACSEEGIRAAIAVGGGRYTFDCDGPTTVVTEAKIVIYNDVVLDGEGNLTVDGDGDHLVFNVRKGVTAELRGLGITNGTSATSFGSGGGIYNAGILTLNNSTVSGNTAGFGGGIANEGTTLTLNNSTVSGNTAGLGGGIVNTGTLELMNATVSANSADWGGGISGTGGTVIMTNSTVSGNISGQGGAIVNPGTLTLTNTLVDGDCTTDVDGVPSGGHNISGGYNIESPGDTCGFDPDGTDLVNVSADDLKLGPLQDNGGPTETHALLPSSVAIDVIPEVDCYDADGKPLTTDQRGEPRDSMCDVGAFEVQP